MLVAAGCSLDFTVRPQPSDAGGSPPDGGTDSDSPIGDAAEEEPISDAGLGDADAAACKALFDDMDAKLKTARACALSSGHCMTTVKNHCDCEVLVAQPNNKPTNDYVAAVNAFKSANCLIAAQCQACGSVDGGSCLYQGQPNPTLQCFP